MPKRYKQPIALILILAVICTAGCSQSQKVDLNVNTLYSDLDSFLNGSNASLEDCFLSDPPSDTDIAFNIETKQIKFMSSGIALETNKTQQKYDCFSIDYDKKHDKDYGTLTLFKEPSRETFSGMRLSEFIEFINNSDFTPLIAPADAKTAKYYELRTDGRYYISLDDYDFSLPIGYTYYLYNDGSFELITEPRGNMPLCAAIFLLAFSAETGELKGNTNVIILYPDTV